MLDGLRDVIVLVALIARQFRIEPAHGKVVIGRGFVVRAGCILWILRKQNAERGTEKKRRSDQASHEDLLSFSGRPETFSVSRKTLSYCITRSRAKGFCAIRVP